MAHAGNHKKSLPVADSSPQVDPVCGMKVSADSPRSARFEGKNYVFCSDGCLAKFNNDPPGVLAKRSQKEAKEESSCCGGVAAVHQIGEQPPAASCCSGHSGAKVNDTPADPTAIYTCPMHPEIEQVGPGDCPICGMDLEPKFVEMADKGDDQQYADMKRRFWIGTVLSIPLLVMAMGPMLGLELSRFMSPGVNGWLQLLL